MTPIRSNSQLGDIVTRLINEDGHGLNRGYLSLFLTRMLIHITSYMVIGHKLCVSFIIQNAESAQGEAGSNRCSIAATLKLSSPREVDRTFVTILYSFVAVISYRARRNLARSRLFRAVYRSRYNSCASCAVRTPRKCFANSRASIV